MQRALNLPGFPLRLSSLHQLSPGPASFTRNPRETISEVLAGVEVIVMRKIFYQIAARVRGFSELAMPTV